VIVAIGGDEGTGDRPQGEEAVVHDVEGLGLVAKVVLAATVLGIAGSSGVSGLIRAGVVDIGGLRVARGDEAAVVGASGGITGTAIVPIGAGRAGTGDTREEAGCVLMMAHHVGTRLDQLAVRGDADAATGRVAGEGGSGGNDAVGHQPQQQAVFTL